MPARMALLVRHDLEFSRQPFGKRLRHCPFGLVPWPGIDADQSDEILDRDFPNRCRQEFLHRRIVNVSALPAKTDLPAKRGDDIAGEQGGRQSVAAAALAFAGQAVENGGPTNAKRMNTAPSMSYSASIAHPLVLFPQRSCRSLASERPAIIPVSPVEPRRSPDRGRGRRGNFARSPVPSLREGITKCVGVPFPRRSPDVGKTSGKPMVVLRH